MQRTQFLRNSRRQERRQLLQREEKAFVKYNILCKINLHMTLNILALPSILQIYILIRFVCRTWLEIPGKYYCFFCRRLSFRVANKVGRLSNGLCEGSIRTVNFTFFFLYLSGVYYCTTFYIPFFRVVDRPMTVLFVYFLVLVFFWYHCIVFSLSCCYNSSLNFIFVFIPFLLKTVFSFFLF